MYEDTWYSFVPELQRQRSNAQPGHRRRESLLQQPNGTTQPEPAETLDDLLEADTDEHEDDDLARARAEGLLLRRVRSFPDGTRAAAARTKPKWAAATAAAAAVAAAAAAAAKAAPPSLSQSLSPLPPTPAPPATPSTRTSRRERAAAAAAAKKKKRETTLEALALADASETDGPAAGLEWQKYHETLALALPDTHDAALLEASQQEFLTYRDQLETTERHLGRLVQDANGALRLLSSLADSFRSVEAQTVSFQAQCDDLLSEQRRLQTLADEVGTDLHYYGYLDTATRRLNAPGSGRLADDEELAEILTGLDACIRFMAEHLSYRDAETYLARYQALLTKALHLLEVGFGARLEKVATELAKQIAGTQSEAAQHALAYGRFEELLVDGSYALLPNVQSVMARVFTPAGLPRPEQPSFSIYADTAHNLLRTYLQWRDQDLRPLVQKELDAFRADTKAVTGAAAVKATATATATAAEASTDPAETAPTAAAAVETASRGLIKQSFERSYHEVLLFAKVFGVDPQYTTVGGSVFATLRAHRSDLVNAVNVAPLASLLQTALAAAADLTVVCHMLGWITHEYLLLEYDDDDGDDDDDDNDNDSDAPGGGHANGGGSGAYFSAHSRQLAARLLTEHLWVFADALFEAEVAKTIARAPVAAEALQIAPAAASGPAGTQAYPPVRRAIELLVLFDQAMPKERCQRNSPVVFKIVKEAIQALQRAEARIQSGRLSTDADLFLIKNLLLLKNELLSLEIGDIRSDGRTGAGAGAGGLQHFGQIWDALSMAQNLVGYFSHFLPATSLWTRGGPPGTATTATTTTAATSATAGSASADQDVGEQLDEALRRSINAFTQRWGKRLREATAAPRGSRLGGTNVAKLERALDELLQAAFSHQPEVVAKLKEAIAIQASAAAAAAAAAAADDRKADGKTSRV